MRPSFMFDCFSNEDATARVLRQAIQLNQQHPVNCPWVLQFGGDAEVLEPAGVRSLVKKALTESLARYVP